MIDEQSKRKIDEDKKRVEELVKLAKEEIKQKKSFDIEKLNKKDRELITRRMSYVPKQREPVKNIQCDEKESQDIKANDQLLLKSIEAIDRLKSPRQIIESVIEKIETNNQKLLEYVEKKAMNGFMLKAYQGLYDKGKKLNMEKVKKESKKKQINKDDMYDYIYTRGTKIKKSNTEKHPFLIEDD